MRTPWNKGKKSGKILTCPICKKEFYARPSSIKKGRRYCSHQCMFKDPEIIKRLSNSHKGQISWNKGKKLGKNPKHSQILKEYYKTHIPPMKGEHHSEEAIQKNRLAHMGKVPWNKDLKNVLSLQGHTFSEETRKKMSEAKKGNIPWNKGKSPSAETLKRYSLAQKRIWSNPEYRKHMSEIHIGQKAYWKGKHIPKEAIRKMVEERHRRGNYSWSKEQKKKLKDIWENDKDYRKRQSFAHSGERSAFWKGGISARKFYSPEWNAYLKRFIRKRDNYICQVCGKKGTSVHHIDYNKMNCSPNNLVTLCKTCHSKTTIQNRGMWKKFFQEKKV